MLDFILDNPGVLFLLIGIFILIVVATSSSKNKKMPSNQYKNNNGQAKANIQNKNSNQTKGVFIGIDIKTGERVTDLTLGKTDKVEVEAGYYRYQDDNQIVIKRDADQQRIFEEYFVVGNIKTITCKSSLKKMATVFKKMSKILFWPGVIFAIIGFASDNDGFGTFGVVLAIAAIVCNIIGNQAMKKFKKSVKSSTTHKKLMTDEEYEQLVIDKIESMDIATLGLDRLGLDPDQVKEIRPIVIRDKVINKTSLTVSSEKDRSIHSSTQHVTYLYFTDEQLFVYKIQFDMCCNMQDEWASEFFYKDICDVSSYTSRNVLKVGNFEYEYSTVAFNIIASNSQIGFELNGANENVGSIQAMKQKIREKKA